MRTIKIAVAALVIATGTLGAFAFTKANTEKKVLNTYYPVKTSTTHFTWQQLNPNEYNCVSGGAACAGYQAASPPADDVIPSGYIKTNQALQLK